MRIWFVGRSCRPFHWWPRIYGGIPSAQYRSAVLGLRPTDLLCWGWWAWEVSR
jgi:hypothetical protein